MTDLAPRPRSATELVDAAFQVYRRQPAQFLVVTAMAYVPWLVVRLVLGIGVRNTLPSVGTLAIIGVGTVLTYSLVSGVVTRIAQDVYLDRPADAGDAMVRVSQQFFTLVAMAFIKIAFLFAGFLLAGVGVFYPLSRYFATTQAVVIEGRGAIDAFERSTKLSDELKLHILGTLILFFVINTALSIGVAVAVNFLPNRVLQQVLATAVSIVLYPLYGIGETLLYFDARIRKEGYDVELLAMRDAPAALPGGLAADMER